MEVDTNMCCSSNLICGCYALRSEVFQFLLRRRRANLLALVDPFSLPAMPLQRSRLVVTLWSEAWQGGCEVDNFQALRCFDFGDDTYAYRSYRFRFVLFFFFSFVDLSHFQTPATSS